MIFCFAAFVAATEVTVSSDAQLSAELVSSRRSLLTATAGFPSCGSHEATQERVVFVHIFKAAGSTIREMLRHYAVQCGRKWVCLVNCDKKKLVGARIACRVKDLIDDRGRKHHVKGRPSLQQVRSADIVGGHISMGISDLYQDYNIHFITFIREPMASVASGVRYKNPKFNIDRVIETLKSNIKKGSHRNAVNYISPKGNYRDALRLMKNFDLVGVVDNWDVSLSLLRQFLGGDGRWQNLKKTQRNKSHGKFTTGDLLNKLDAPTMAIFANFTRDETRLFEAALDAHRETCATITKGRTRPQCNCRLVRRTGSPNRVVCAPLLHHT